MEKLVQDSKKREKGIHQLQGWWRFNEYTGKKIRDLSGNGNDLICTGSPQLFTRDRFTGMMLNGVNQWLSTSKPIIRTDRSFSIIVWVLLDSTEMKNTLRLSPNVHALTALSQDSPNQSAFHLGIRQIKNVPVRDHTTPIKWCFTVSPKANDPLNVECQDAYCAASLDISMLDKWIMLAGVYDVIKKSATLYVPSINDVVVTHMPETWNFWHADGGFQVGRSLWEKQAVDQWPGGIAAARTYAGVLQDSDIKQLYREDLDHFNH